MRPAPLLLTCAILLSPERGRADSQPPRPHLAFRFEYTHGRGTESCPSEHTVHDLLMGALSYDPVKPDAAPRAEIAITRKWPGFHAEITIYDDAGTLAWAQELDDRARCMPLVRLAVAVVAAMMPRPTPPPPPTEPSTPPPTKPLPPPPAAPPASSPVRTSFPSVPASPPSPNRGRLQVGAGLTVNFGLVPGSSAGGFVFLTDRWTAFSITGELHLMGSVLPASKQVDPGGPSFVRGQFFGVAGAPCLHTRHFFGCVPVHVGGLTGSGGHWVLVKTESPWVLATSLRFGAEGIIAKRFVLRGFVEATGIVTRTRILTDSAEVWKTPPACASAGIAFAVPL